MRSLIARFAVPVLAVALLAQPARADMTDDCVQTANPKLALDACTQAINSGQWSGSDLAWAYNNRGNAYVNLGEPRRGIEDLEEAMRLRPRYARAFYNRGVAYEDLGQDGTALKDYNTAISYDSDYADAYYNRGVLHAEAGRKDEAFRDMEQTLRLEPNAVDALTRRGLILASYGDYGSAIADYDRALQINPSYGYAYSARATAHCNTGSYARSTQDRLESIHLGRWTPRNAQSWLKERGYYTGSVDGIMNAGTEKAVGAWTRDGCPGL